jgi:hypothetical protein
MLGLYLVRVGIAENLYLHRASDMSQHIAFLTTAAALHRLYGTYRPAHNPSHR